MPCKVCLTLWIFVFFCVYYHENWFCPAPKVTRNNWLAASRPWHPVLLCARALKAPDAFWLHCLSVLHFFLNHSNLSPYRLTTLLLLSTKHISLHSDSYFNTVYFQSWTKYTTRVTWSLDDCFFCWTKINLQGGQIKFRQTFLGTKPWIVNLRQSLWPVRSTANTIIMVVHRYKYLYINTPIYVHNV